MDFPWALARLGLGMALLAVRPGLADEDWPQFRGPNGQGVAAAGSRPPVAFGPTNQVAWQMSLPPGNASPAIRRGRVFTTGFQEGRLVTLALDAASGREIWRREVTPRRVEEVHPSLGSPASATPALDDGRVFVFFGSAGLLAYDWDGRELWRHELALPQTEYGASSSPVVAGDLVVQLLDQDGGSFLLAVNTHTGREAWRVERPEMRRGFGTPVLWSHHGQTDLVVPGTLWLRGLDPQSGAQRWQVGGLARITCTSPVIGENLLLTASWTTGGDRSADRITMPDFNGFAAEHDRDQDGRFTLAELPDGPVKQRFKHLDGNRNGFIERSEWESMAAIFARVENQAFAVRPDAQGSVSDAGVLWRFKKGLPYVASPLLYEGRFYLVKNGGMLTCLDPVSGKPHYQEERLGPVGDYYASLVAADGRIYVPSQRGVITVVKAGETFEVLARNDLGETIQATPALVGDRIYVRTASRLYAFGPKTGIR